MSTANVLSLQEAKILVCRNYATITYRMQPFIAPMPTTTNVQSGQILSDQIVSHKTNEISRDSFKAVDVAARAGKESIVHVTDSYQLLKPTCYVCRQSFTPPLRVSPSRVR